MEKIGKDLEKNKQDRIRLKHEWYWTEKWVLNQQKLLCQFMKKAFIFLGLMIKNSTIKYITWNWYLSKKTGTLKRKKKV